MTFAGNRLGNNATLVRYSNESDAALIKIDTPEALHKVEIADDDRPSTGERAIVLGFPAIAAETYAIEDTIENGNFIRNKELVPQPYVTEGIVALVSKKIPDEERRHGGRGRGRHHAVDDQRDRRRQ